MVITSALILWLISLKLKKHPTKILHHNPNPVCRNYLSRSFRKTGWCSKILYHKLTTGNISRMTKFFPLTLPESQISFPVMVPLLVPKMWWCFSYLIEFGFQTTILQSSRQVQSGWDDGEVLGLRHVLCHLAGPDGRLGEDQFNVSENESKGYQWN